MAMGLRKGDVWIGYDMIPERKKPVFGIIEGNTFTVYVQFRSEKAAQVFMEKLADMVGAKREDEDGK